MQINFLKKEVVCKIVYYGPGMSGKTTNLQQINEKTPADRRSNLTSIATEGERTLFFDYMPLNLGTVGGMSAKLQLYTVPGQIYYNATRKLVLQGVDGVVFVADSQKEQLNANLESWQNLSDNLREYGISIQEIPLVIQWNKRDLPNAQDTDLLEKSVNRYGVPTIEAVAAMGEGVVETLKLIASLVLTNLNKKQDTLSSINKPAPPTVSPLPAVSRPDPVRVTFLQRVKRIGQRCWARIRRTEKVLATIDDLHINEAYLMHFYGLQIRLNGKSSAENEYGNLTKSQKRKTLDQLVEHCLLLREAQKAGVTASKPEVDKHLNSYIDKFGSIEQYKAHLAQRKLKLDDIKDEITKQILMNKLIKNQIPSYQEKMRLDEAQLLNYYRTSSRKLNGSFEDQKKEIEQLLTKEKRTKLNQELFELLRKKTTIKTYLENL